MRGFATANLRRTLRKTAVFAVPAAILAGTLAGGLASAVPAQASSGHLSVTINAMTPSYAAPGATVRLSGTVTNGTRQTQAGLDVQLFTSASHFIARDRMDAYVSRGAASDLIPDSLADAERLSPGLAVRQLDLLSPATDTTYDDVLATFENAESARVWLGSCEGLVPISIIPESSAELRYHPDRLAPWPAARSWTWAASGCGGSTPRTCRTAGRPG